MNHNLIWALIESREFKEFDEVKKAEHLDKQIAWGYPRAYNNIHVDIVILLEEIAELNKELSFRRSNMHELDEVHMGILEELADVYIETEAVAMLLGCTHDEFEEKKNLFVFLTDRNEAEIITDIITMGSKIQQSLCKIIRGKEVDKEQLLDHLAIVNRDVEFISNFYDSDFPVFMDVVNIKLTRIASRLV